MAKATRDSRLETRTVRAKLKQRDDPYWREITLGLYLGYRKGKKSASWIVRRYDKSNSRYVKKVLALSDDYRDSDGIDVLTYFEAQEAARDYAEQAVNRGRKTPQKPPSVAEVMEEYLTWYSIHKKAYKQTKHTVDAHILPCFGKRLVFELTTREISRWRDDLAKKNPHVRSKLDKQNTRIINNDADAKRKRKATANRILTVLKAALNHSFFEGILQETISDNGAWRNVKPFKEVDEPKISYLEKPECTRLLKACPPDFALLVMGALLTGGRYGELVSLRCGDYSPDNGQIHFQTTKSGKPRPVWLTKEGTAFFDRVTASRKKREVIFLRQDCKPWGKSHQARPMKEACQLADISPEISFHGLRHTYGSLLVSSGVPLQVVAESLGHADTRITQRHYGHIKPSYVADTIRKNLPEFGGGDLIEDRP